MQTNQANANQVNSYQPNTLPVGNPKTLASPGTKALGGTAGDPALAGWYEDAYAYYNAVMSGQESMPDPASWNDFLNQMSWAAGQLGLGGWDPMAGGQNQPAPGSGPFPGANNNMAYDYEANEITATGQEITHDSWGYEDTLDIPSTAADVEYQMVMDDSVQPPQQILKVIVTNQITGAQEIFNFHNAGDPDFKLTINVPRPDQVKGAANNVDIEIGKFDMKAETEGGVSNEASIEGELIDENTYLYDGTGHDEIDFHPVGSGEVGEVTYHDVHGSANISFKNTDEVLVETAPAGSDYDFVLTVEHKDGSKDVFYLRKEYQMNLNGIPEHITFKDGEYDMEPFAIEDKDGGTTYLVMKAFAENFTINRDETGFLDFSKL